jgi:hypothetical protein
MVSILMRNVSLTVLLKSGKLKVLRYLNKHNYFTEKHNVPSQLVTAPLKLRNPSK